MFGLSLVRSDGRTEILPCVLQDIVPFGAAAEKGVKKKKLRHPVPPPVLKGFEGVYNQLPPPLTDQQKAHVAEMFETVREVCTEDDGGPFPVMSEVRFTNDNVLEVLRDYSGKKTAPGRSGIDFQDLAEYCDKDPSFLAEMVRIGNEMIDEARAQQDPTIGNFGTLLAQSIVPALLTKVKTVLLPKKDPTSTDPKKWRPIALIECALKVLLEVIRRAIAHFLTVPLNLDADPRVVDSRLERFCSRYCTPGTLIANLWQRLLASLTHLAILG